MLDRIYKFRWIRKKVKWNGDKKLKCSSCGYVFKENDKCYIKYSRWLGVFTDILCEKCYKEKLKKG